LRKGKSPFSGDRGHLHFRLLDKGFRQRQIVLGYYIFCTFFGVLTLITSSQLFKFIALGVLGLMVVGGLVVLTRLNYGRSSTSSS
jgi:UDP-GlcNAc:undecaprenyl-phosphate GlcNAc-1-phosphate transferase